MTAFGRRELCEPTITVGNPLIEITTVFCVSSSQGTQEKLSLTSQSLGDTKSTAGLVLRSRSHLLVVHADRRSWFVQVLKT
jgi:hypothetical protein